MDFAAGSGGGRFESSFQTLGCLVSRHGRLFVKSHDRERPQGDMSDHRGTGTIFPTKRTLNGLSDLTELHFVVGKMIQSLGSAFTPNTGGQGPQTQR
jgi:hypothetical protein